MFSCKIQILDLYICRWDFWSPFSDSHSQSGSSSPFLVTAATIEVFLKRNFWNQPWILSLQVFRGHWLALFPNVLINDFISYVIIIINTNILASRTYHVQSLSQGVPAHYRTKDGGHQIGFGGLVTIISLPAWSPSSPCRLGHHHLLASLVTIISTRTTWTIIVTNIATVVTTVDIKWKT